MQNFMLGTLAPLAIFRVDNIHQWIEALSALGAVWVYFRNSRRERAEWLSKLYSKFYEEDALKAVREVLDRAEADSAQIKKMVLEEDGNFTDYLNFFEFMAYLARRRQLSRADVAALFDYYLCILNKHTIVQEYIREGRNGFEYLKGLLTDFPYVAS
jgi:hypothetical protein